MSVTYSDYQDAHDLVSVVTQRIDTLIERHIEQLLKGGADRHDHLTGIIKGLQTAKTNLLETGKKWRAGEDILDEDPRQTKLVMI